MLSWNRKAGVRTLFLQCVALSYTIAFYSLYTQIPGLYGDDGLLPASSYIINLKLSPSLEELWRNPTLLQFSKALHLSVTQMMEVLCLAGTVLSLWMTVAPSLLTKPTFFMLWLSYLSVYKVGQTFLWFQWDILLLETGFIAIIAAPFLPGYHRRPMAQDTLSLYLVRWLLFRMMFASGVVKLTSGCPTWWGLTAMPTHYFSQCLPTWLAWYARQLPDWMHRLSVASTFVIEIPMSFLFFAPTSSLRKFTFFNQIMLMVIIMLTGNYNFFNFLFMALCLSLADDSWIGGNIFNKPQHPLTRCACCLFHMIVYAGLGLSVTAAFGLHFNHYAQMESAVQFTEKQFDLFLAYAVPAGILLGLVGLFYASVISLKDSFSTPGVCGSLFTFATVLVYIVVSCLMFATSLPSFTGQLDRHTYDILPKYTKDLDKATDRFELTSSYGLFRRMTGVGGRPEIILEGSDHPGGPWKEYDFIYKPGDINAAPRFCLPHQPRLDWQMWFAALGSYNNNPWFISLVLRLLEGRPEVLQLLHPDTPFSSKPPKFIRAQLYIYEFTEAGSSPAAAWWTRRLDREYLPVVSLQDGLKEMLIQNGIIGTDKTKTVPGTGTLPDLLSAFRKISDGYPPHLQLWSFAWLALPLFKQLLV